MPTTTAEPRWLWRRSRRADGRPGRGERVAALAGLDEELLPVVELLVVGDLLGAEAAGAAHGLAATRDHRRGHGHAEPEVEQDHRHREGPPTAREVRLPRRARTAREGDEHHDETGDHERDEDDQDFHGGRHKNLWLFVITIPFWTSYLLRVMAWKVVLGFNGVLNSGLMGLGIIDEPSTALLYNSTAVLITLTHAWVAFAILPIYVSLEKVDRTLIEAATDLGDGPIRSFLRVTLPLSLPGVTAALLIVMIPTVGDYVTPRLVGGSDGVMIANAIQAQFGRAMNKPLGAALSVTTMIAVCAMAGATVLALRTAVRAFR